MHSGRPLVLAAMLASPTALDEAAPPFVPGVIRPLFRPVARWVTRGFVAKYDIHLGDESHVRKLREVLLEVRAGLSSGRRSLLGRFTYEALAKEFADLIAWRDQLYVAQRTATM